MLVPQPGRHPGAAPFHVPMCRSPGLTVHFQHLTYRFQTCRFGFRKYRFNNLRDFSETNVSLEKRSYCNLIGGVKCNCLRSTGPCSFIRQPQTREFFHIRGVEFEIP